jgi:glycine cleavage system H protein
MAYPKDYKYSRDHEWVSVKGKTARIGITQYAEKQLGDIVMVDLPKVGDSFRSGQPFGTVESVKSVSELYAPASGKVTAANDDLVDEPELVNEDPHETWLVEIEIKDPKELDSLLSAAQYEALLAEEG